MNSAEKLKAARMFGVDLAYWNPDRTSPDSRVSPADNFGDLLGPLVVQLVLASGGVISGVGSSRLLSVGSITHFAQENDVMWGSGINGKRLDYTPRGVSLDIRAVRGPWSAAELTSKGYRVPEVYGDPALLLGKVMPEVPRFSHLAGRRLLVPNMNDLELYRSLEPEALDADLTVLDPSSPVHVMLSAIAHADLVIGSSLHAIILADAYGVPARFIRSSVEPEFKYVDYLLGTGRPTTVIARDIGEAMSLGGHEAPIFDAEAMLSAFPWDLWGAGADNGAPPPSVFTLSNGAHGMWQQRITGASDVVDLTDQFTTAVEQALADRNASAEQTMMLVDMRRLVVPDVDRRTFPRHIEPVVYAIDRGHDRALAALLSSGGARESFRVRTARDLGRSTLISLDVELCRAVGPQTQIELISETASGQDAHVPVWLSAANYGQLFVECDVLIDSKDYSGPHGLHVRITGEDGELLYPMAVVPDNATDFAGRRV